MTEKEAKLVVLNYMSERLNKLVKLIEGDVSNEEMSESDKKLIIKKAKEQKEVVENNIKFYSK